MIINTIAVAGLNQKKMTAEPTVVPFSLGPSFPPYPSAPCKKRPEVDLLTIKEARQCDLELQEKRYQLQHGDNWVPLFTNKLFVPGECVAFEQGKYIESVGLPEGMYIERERSAGSSRSGGKLPLFETALRKRGLSWANPRKISKAEDKSKLNRVHFLRTQLGGFKQLPDVRGNPGQSKLLHTVKRLRQVRVSLDIPEDCPMSFQKMKDCKPFKSFGIITAVVYHEARFGTTEHEDLSYSESVSRESRSDRNVDRGNDADADSDGEQAAAKAKEPRMLFISFVQIRELQLQPKDKELLRPSRAFSFPFSRLLPFGKKKTADHDPSPMSPTTLSTSKSTPATVSLDKETTEKTEVEPKPKPAAQSRSKAEVQTEVPTPPSPKRSTVIVHIWESVLAATLAEARTSSGPLEQRHSLVFLLVKNLEFLQPMLRSRLLPNEPLSEEAVQRWFASRFSHGPETQTKADFMGFANEFRYNFKGETIPETLRRNFFRPSVFPLNKINSLMGCSVFAKNSALEPLLAHLQNFRNLKLLEAKDCVGLFKLIANASMSRTNCVDLYDPKRTRATLCKAALLRRSSPAELAAFIEAGEVIDGPVDCGPLEQVETIGHAFLYSLGSRSDADSERMKESREVAMDLIKLWDFGLLKEEICVRVFKRIAPVLTSENVGFMRRFLLELKTVEVDGGSDSVSGVVDKLEALDEVSLESLQGLFTEKEKPLETAVEDVATVQLMKKVEEAEEGVEVWMCRTGVGFARCAVKKLDKRRISGRTRELAKVERRCPERFAVSDMVVTVDGDCCVVFPRCVETLETLLDTIADVAFAERRKLVCSIAADMVRAVAALHEQGATHGRLSLSSFGVTQEGEVKLLLAAAGDGGDTATDLVALGACLFKLDVLQSPTAESVSEDIVMLDVEELTSPVLALMQKDAGEVDLKSIADRIAAVGKVGLTGRNSLLGNPAAVDTTKADALFDLRIYLR